MKPKTTKPISLATIKRNRKTWVKALCSGDYKQGQLALREGRRYCCLGVANKACELKVPWRTVTEWGMETAGHLSPGARAKLGLTAKQQQRLIRLNDSCGSNFQQIADYIEKLSYPKGLK